MENKIYSFRIDQDTIDKLDKIVAHLKGGEKWHWPKIDRSTTVRKLIGDFKLPAARVIRHGQKRNTKRARV